jgi:hypothetical protein
MVWAGWFDASARPVTSCCAEGERLSNGPVAGTLLYVSSMEERITHPAMSHGSAARSGDTRDASAPARFERPTIESISLCCEISAYAPDGDDRPLF